MKTFTDRLQWCIKHGDMTIADLHHWFERPRSTVRAWVLLGNAARDLPSGFIEKRLLLLETRIKARDGFPIPPIKNQLARPDYIKGLRSGKHPRVPTPRSPG